MRVVFAGTPEFARVALERLLAAGFTVPLVFWIFGAQFMIFGTVFLISIIFVLDKTP